MSKKNGTNPEKVRALDAAHEGIGEPQMDLGRIVISRYAYYGVPWDRIGTCLAQHQMGNWGLHSLDERMKTANDRAIASAGCPFSAFSTGRGSNFWILTDRCGLLTNVFVPEEIPVSRFTI
jgi:hypothetical protein